MTVLLHQQGLFTWTEWAQALSAQIAAGQVRQVTAGQGLGAGFPGQQASSAARVAAPAAGTPYYQHWLAALETLVAAKGLSSPDELTRHQRAWEHAAHRTPHGMSIDLQSEDIGR